MLLLVGLNRMKLVENKSKAELKILNAEMAEKLKSNASKVAFDLT